MKTHKLLIIAIVVLGLPVVGCHRANPANQVAVETKTAPAGPVELELKWPAGRHGIYTSDVKETAQMTMPGRPQPMAQEMSMTQDSALTVLPPADGGGRALEMEYLDAKMSMALAGKSMLSYDSTNASAGDNNPAAATLGKMIGAKIRFVLDASNQVASVEGADELAQQLKSGPGGDLNGMLKNITSPDMLKQQIDFAHYLPGKAVQPGDTWPIQLERNMGPMGVTLVNDTFTFDSWEKHGDRYCARLEIDGTLKTKPGQSAGTPGMTFDIRNGKISGEAWFDVDMGMFVEMTFDEDMQMSITMPNPMAQNSPGQPKTMTVQSAMHETITTKFALK